MSILKTIDVYSGHTLRWAANLLTGNYYKRIEGRLISLERDIQKLNANLKKLDDISGPEAAQMVSLMRAMFDEQQERTLREFNAETDRRK